MSRKYFNCYRPGKHTIKPAMRVIHAGLKAHGWECVKPYNKKAGCEFALCWGPKQDFNLKHNIRWDGPVLYAEVEYISALSGKFTDYLEYATARSNHVCFSWNSMHGLGDDYLPAIVPTDRFDALGVVIHPWQLHPEGRVLILGQSIFDPMAIPPGEDRAWNETLVPLAERVFGEGKVDFRPHPRYTDFSSNTVGEAAHGYRRVVTYASTAAIETILAGIPTQVISAVSVAYPMACHEFTDYEITPDRAQWAAKLAYRQFTYPEIESGYFWDIIKPGLRGRARYNTYY